MDEEVPLDSIHPRCVTSGTHLIVGGFGGLGVELCDWLLSNGAACVSGLPKVLINLRPSGPGTAGIMPPK